MDEYKTRTCQSLDSIQPIHKRKKAVPIQEDIGKRYRRLVVIDIVRRPVGRQGRLMLYALCKCDCGTKKVVNLGSLRKGITGSCGCYQRENTGRRSRTHGLSKTTTYKIWADIKSRCNNPKQTGYKYYGGRGIRICERWNTFETFLEDMGKRPSARHSIERIDNNGDYCPENCRWATVGEQARNRSSNRWASLNGESMIITDWAKRFGVLLWTVRDLIMTFGEEDALQALSWCVKRKEGNSE